MTSLEYRPRLVDAPVTALLAAFPAVMLGGPRAAGKTTTGRAFAADTMRLDQPGQAAVVRADPDAALRGRHEPLLIDEWQEVPEVLGAVKRAIDDDPRPGRFLLAGSVRAHLQQSVWPGTGRVIELTLFPLTERELAGRLAGDGFIDRLVNGELADISSNRDIHDYVDASVRGGYPDVAIRGLPPDLARAWHNTYLEALITRDVVELSPRADPERLRQYLEAIALNTAGLPADVTVNEAAGVTAVTGRRYDELLAEVLVADSVPAWASNRLKRLMRRSKRFMVDSGLGAAAARWSRDSILADGDALGRLLETFVAAQLRPEIGLTLGRQRLFHLRTDKGRREVDLLVELESGGVVAIEVKATAAPGPSDAVHLEWLREELGDQFVRGCVLHTGPRAFPLGDRVIAAPISALWET